MRGSPHLHALIWTSDCPKLTNNSIEEYVQYVDKHVQACLPDKDNAPELHELVKTYQKHTHSRTCRKYRNTQCRIHFGQFFTNQTIVAEPLSTDLTADAREEILWKRNAILTSVKEKINEVLDPSNPNYDPNLNNKHVLDSAGISETSYYWALSISGDSDHGLHLKRSVDSCFINNYFIAGIKGFSANVGLQPFFNHYKCLTYVCSYFSKDETECSQAIVNSQEKQAPADLGPPSNHQGPILHLMVHNQPLEISDDAPCESVRSLNDKQRSAYDIVLKWCREKIIKNLNSLKPEIVEPNYFFVTGGAGAGNSHSKKQFIILQWKFSNKEAQIQSYCQSYWWLLLSSFKSTSAITERYAHRPTVLYFVLVRYFTSLKYAH